LIAEQNAIRKELQEVEKQLSLYVSNSSITHESIFDDDDDDDLLVQFTDNKEKDDNAPKIFKTVKPTVTPPKPQKTAPTPVAPVENNNAKNEAVERPAPTITPQKEVIKNNENKAKEVVATKAPTAPALDKKPQAQLSPGLATQNTPTPPKAEPPKQAKTAQQQALQTKPTPPTPPRPTTQDRAEDKAPVKPTITQEPTQQQAQEQQKPLTAYDRPINQYYDILATHKRSFAKQNDISTVKKLYPSDSPIYLNYVNEKGNVSLNKGKQTTDLHLEIYRRFRSCRQNNV
jgi:hypothetical protein